MESKPDGAASLSCEELAAVEDEEVLNKMLDNATDFEERRMIRAALRDLLKKKRDKREQDRGSRQQDLRQQGLSKGGTTGGGVSVGRASMNQQPTTNSESDLLRDHILLSVSILYFHFIPSIFSEAPGQSSASGPFNRTAGGKAGPASAQQCPPAAAPNAKNVKQMLLDWCRAKTEPYEGVDIQNFSSSWKDGIAFCALVHRFFPDSFEYSILNPNQHKENFQLAFSTAERLAGCPPLLDPDDLVRMREPDWKCVYTYIQEFYRCLVEKGLVKTKKRP
ncbi:smoothelin isoform X1 [Stegastes partitus]|uniref:Smoothelin-like isoform X1 n=1 Tax=Stegastes partitus TaxID=144197 RepID=A0A9Y4NGT8_9TELE|nr:PREDICTED: smoothelin-like isoform X1 [Stegastes partitus]XP_008297011.1 PREDICTED: smoothelin-like isoform X1 [Stegastes partitus]